MKHFYHRHLPSVGWRVAVTAGLGAAIAIALLTFATDYAHALMLMGPFGATCVLLFAAPTAPLSQPANVVGGHFLSALIGLGLGILLPMGNMTGAFAVGLAIAGMLLLRVVHPPAGATALVAATSGSWSFLVFPVLSGAIVLVIIAAIYHHSTGKTYPLRAS